MRHWLHALAKLGRVQARRVPALHRHALEEIATEGAVRITKPLVIREPISV